ncbi:MAG: UDP-N-acetylmuramoyl-L-alanine--D-glutamate ligase [Ruminiclostridium sp.]|nr:UDP-N-acetylmuramoyl-L-alanine--D-glutamate ligase [Ruminiclostridium sp.]
MNQKLADYKNYIRDKKVAVLGIGISNTPLIKYLAAIGVDITAFDKSEEKDLREQMKTLDGLKINYSLGKDYMSNLKAFDVIFKTPRVRFDIPELVAESERGAVITSEMEVFCDLCPARIFAVTGSDGKTTTTTLIYEMLKNQGFKCWLGGNIGIPLLDRIDEIDENDMVVLELSSFQLHTMKCRLNTAVVTNISHNHLDVHKSMEEYIDAKKNIFRYQTGDDQLILNYDNEIVRNFGEEAESRVVYFSRIHDMGKGMMLDADCNFIYKTVQDSKIIMNSEAIQLPGVHNTENYLAAAAAVVDYVEPGAIRQVARSFKGVEHRNELVRELNGIKFYNDSIGSSPTRTIATMKSFKQKLILITGGYDKNIPYDDMGQILTEQVKCLVLIGQTGLLIEKVFYNEVGKSGKGREISIYKCHTLEEAVEKAYTCAVKNDIILLSPASASFDMFKNFEERGNRFKEIVNSL